MFVVTYQLGRAALIDITRILIALASSFIIFRFRINSVWLVLAAAIAGIILTLI